MAIFHVAENTPPKAEIISQWLADQPWGPQKEAAIELLGSFHLDDPAGQVGMQVFLVQADDMVFQIPLSYRDAPLDGSDHAFIAEMEHSVLGTRYLYDGLGDERFVLVYAGVTVHGYGQALGFAEHEGRWYSVPDELVVKSAGPLSGRIAVDGFSIQENADAVQYSNDRFDFTIFRRPPQQATAPTFLSTSWALNPTGVVLTELQER